MSAVGRGRGYPGRHQARAPRPGASHTPGPPTPGPHTPGPPTPGPHTPAPHDAHAEDALRTLTELSPRAAAVYSESSKPESYKNEVTTERAAGGGSCEEEWGEVVGEGEGELTPEEEAQLQQLLHVDDRHLPLLTLLEQFSPGEDGIQFNRKLRQFEAAITAMCPDDAALNAAFGSLCAWALGGAEGGGARRLAGAGAALSRAGGGLRAALLTAALQPAHDRLALLARAARTRPHLLANAADLMGDYYCEARLCDGGRVSLVAAPLAAALRALAAVRGARPARSLATQLLQNGRDLLPAAPQHMAELARTVRARLAAGAAPPHTARWLLLAADLSAVHYRALPQDLQRFYVHQLQLDLTSPAPSHPPPPPADDPPPAAPRPRAILGAGAAAARRPPPPAARPYWAHDDRTDRDYTS